MEDNWPELYEKYGHIEFLSGDSSGTLAVVESDYRGFIGTIIVGVDGLPVMLGQPMVSGVERGIIVGLWQYGNRCPACGYDCGFPQECQDEVFG